MNEIYPLTIILDRYNGAYSGGVYLAFNLEYHEIPKEISGSDVECFEFWQYNEDLIVGKGKTIEEACIDLYIKLKGEEIKYE